MEQKKKKKKKNIVSRKSSFPLMSLSHTHINTYMRTLSFSLSLSLSLPLVYSFYCSVCLSTGCLLAVVMVHCFIYFVYLFIIFTLLGVIINSAALPFQRPKCEYSHFSLVRTISGKEKILYYRELLVSEKFFKTRWIRLTRLFHLVLSSNFRLSKKNAHDFAVWYRSSCTRRCQAGATFKTLAACEIPVFYSCL